MMAATVTVGKGFKTELPTNCPAVQESGYQCVCCWAVVPGKWYDFENELCSVCSKALVHKETP